MAKCRNCCAEAKKNDKYCSQCGSNLLGTVCNGCDLLTAVIQDYKGLTQVVLRAHSDKKYGLNGFMNEMADSLRHLVGSVQNTKEIGIIENTQVINIIDSVVQRTNFEIGEGGNAQINIRDSVVQKSKIGKEE